MNTTTITVQITLQGEQDDYDLQQAFLERLPERYGKVTLVDARIVAGGVDRDGVPVTPRSTKAKQ